jgi:hypothetical protein
MDEDLKLPPLPEPDGACDLMDANPGDAWSEELVREYARAAVLAERERAARTVEDVARAWWKRGHIPPPSDIAAAIRGNG